MKAEIITMTEKDLDMPALKRAGEVIKRGGLVAFPTETVYGLGGNALDPEASRKIYAAKGRPSDNPLIVHIARREDLFPLVKMCPEAAMRLADAFWPGPLTMIFPKSERVPYETTGGLDSVAVRFPNHAIARELIALSGGYVAAPSANASGRPSPTKASHVIDDLGERIDMIIDGGDVGIGLESTIVDFTEEIPTVLRPGYINREMLERILGEVRIDPGLVTDVQRPKAPGMKYRHYAPRAPLFIVEGGQEAVVDEINRLSAEEAARGGRPGIIGTTESQGLYREGTFACIGSRQDEEEIARHLFNVLREFDDGHVTVIYSESFYTPRMGQAIMNRLLKAAGHQVIKV